MGDTSKGGRGTLGMDKAQTGSRLIRSLPLAEDGDGCAISDRGCPTFDKAVQSISSGGREVMGGVEEQVRRPEQASADLVRRQFAHCR